ncbi:MAG: uroporphyrinogen-III C-methyltransferase [Spirochaetia bacterium]|nr:uroporphyrinogen-III C-methyltransferase [Spirochaetia bacterium]
MSQPVEKKEKKIYLIGAGPGDPKLLTLKAIEAIQASQAILYDQLVNPDVLQYAQPGANLVFVGKKKGKHIIPQDDINKLLVELAGTYDTVSRLKGGDPFIFGRGGEELEHLAIHGYSCEVIPGITSAAAAAAYIGLPLTHRNYSSQIIFITGHKKEDGDYSEFTSLDLHDKTAVIYMGVTALHEIVREMCRKEGNCELPIAIIENATLPSQRVIRGTLGNIVEIASHTQITPPALIIIGNIIKFMDRIEEVMK